MNKKHFLLIFSLLISSWAKTYGQDPHTDAGQLPSTSMQGDFSGVSNNIVNVDLFTGTASAHIPIFSYGVDGIDGSISLDYNAKGLQVDQTASSVGLGWNLNAGGYIVRSVHGVEDEISLPLTTAQYISISHAPTESGGLPVPFQDGSQYRGYLVDSANAQGAYESEHDEFTAVFGGREVTFAIAYDGTIVTRPHTNLTIQMFVDGVQYKNKLPNTIGLDSVHHLLSFVIRDEVGNFFTFQRGDYEDDTSSFDNTTPYYPTTKWVLTQVKTNTGKIIQYTYNYYFSSYKQYSIDTAFETRDQSNNTYSYVSGASRPVFLSQHISHISSIAYPDGTTVTFNLTGAAGRCDLLNIDRLSSISISKGNLVQANIITYNLNQSYYSAFPNTAGSAFNAGALPLGNNPNTSCDYIAAAVSANLAATTADAIDMVQLKLRLMLNSITKTVNSDNTEPYYTFSYNSIQLPPRLSPSQDWYGYYNGKNPVADPSNNVLGIPRNIADGTLYGVDKTPDLTYQQAGILTNITNGLGGNISLIYQAPPSLSNIDNTLPGDMNESVNTSDGLCISQISYSDGASSDNNSYTFYTFENGYRFFEGGYFWYPVGYLNNDYTGRRITNHMVSAIDFYNGSNHGYSKVTVTKKGINNEVLDKIVYNYSNIISGSNTYIYNDQSAATKHTFPRAWMDQTKIGLVNEIDEYANAALPVKITSYQYHYHLYDSIINTAHFSAANQLQIDEYGGTSSINDQLDYNVFNPNVCNVASATTQTIMDGGSITSTINYTYNKYNQLSTQSWDDTKGNVYTKFSKYDYDYSLNGFTPNGTVQTAAANAINAMKNDSIQYLITTETVQGLATKYTSPASPTVNGIQDALTYTNSGSTTNLNTAKVMSFAQAQPAYSSPTGILNAAAGFTAQLAQPSLYQTLHVNSGNQAFGANQFFNYDANIATVQDGVLRDNNNNVVEQWSDNHQKCNSAVWDLYYNKTAAANNAGYHDIAYTSFEYLFSSFSNANITDGNWSYNPNHITSGASITGNNYYSLTSGNSISTAQALANKKYLVSFWCDNVPAVQQQGQAVTMTQQNMVGSWKFYTGYLNGSNGAITISGTNIKIDELRLLPADASMDTYTYNPLFGPSSHCDDRGNIQYYEYDNMGRLSVTRDINKNIISLQKAAVQSNDN